MAPEALALLPYFIYADQYHLRKGDGKGLTMDDCLKMEAEYERVPPKQHRSGGHDWVIDMFGSEYYLAETIKGYVLEHAILAYNAKYGNVDMPTIARDEIADYERRANSGDVAAMRELRRYYEFPDPGSYNPEQAESRYWLSREIAAGDEGAMLEAGYGRPYSVRTELVYDGTSVAMDVACEGIVGQDGAPYPACFLYNLLIGDNPARVGHLVLDQDHLSGLSVRPQIIALRMAGGR
jgi:hypothetical protein